MVDLAWEREGRYLVTVSRYVCLTVQYCTRYLCAGTRQPGYTPPGWEVGVSGASLPGHRLVRDILT